MCDGLVQYLDRSNPMRWSAALLASCDTAGFEMWDRFPTCGRVTPNVLSDMRQVQANALMRTNYLTLLEPYDASDGPRISVVARLVHVGKTSYTVLFALHSSSGGLFATVETVMVATDAATHTRPEALAHAEVLRDLVDSSSSGRASRTEFAPPDAAAAPLWSGVVRATDCDDLQVVRRVLLHG